ncbi:uncharacterized protein C10orf95-like [Anomalospiza imberbis]|uniref:uncharacterized protein C10orf95-like n=1 Tax=Anomalospiza imberbis TaxID=187417 RepID=UPI00358EBC26
MRSPLSRLFSKLIRPGSPSLFSYERCSTLPTILAALGWSRALPAPSTRGGAASGLQRSPLSPAAADTNHSGPGSGPRSLGPAALRGRAGLTSRLPEPPGQGRRRCRARREPPGQGRRRCRARREPPGQGRRRCRARREPPGQGRRRCRARREPPGQSRRWCRARREPPPPDDARPPRDARLPRAARRRRLRSPETAEILPESGAPRAQPQRAGDGDMAAGRQPAQSAAGGGRPRTERPQ